MFLASPSPDLSPLVILFGTEYGLVVFSLRDCSSGNIYMLSPLSFPNSLRFQNSQASCECFVQALCLPVLLHSQLFLHNPSICSQVGTSSPSLPFGVIKTSSFALYPSGGVFCLLQSTVLSQYSGLLVQFLPALFILLLKELIHKTI